MSTFASRIRRGLANAFWLERLSRARIVDREYVEALSGRKFASDRGAIRYYLKHESEAALGLSLSPLVEANWIQQQLPENHASWYAALFSTRELLSTSPQFDAARYVEKSGVTASTTLHALKHFLRHASPSSTMPVSTSTRGVPPTWAEYRGRCIDDARQYREQIGMIWPRTTETWDEAGARAFRVRMRNASQGISVSGKVSVVLHTHDRLASLEMAIASVIAQTYVDWELIVVDDQSTDGTIDIVDAITRLEPRVRRLVGPGQGLAAARNVGLSAASGDFVAFLDPDTTWLPEFLELSLFGMRNNGVRAVHSGVRVHDDVGIHYGGMSGTQEDLLLVGNFIEINSTVVSRALLEAVGRFDESLKHCVDYDFVLALSALEVPTYLPFQGVNHDCRSSAGQVASSASPSWEGVVVGKHLVDWGQLRRDVGDRDRGLVSIIIPTYADWELTAAAVRAVLDNSGGRPFELLVIDNGSRRHVRALLRGLFGASPQVRIERMPRNLNFALANNYGMSLSRGQYVVTLNNDTEVAEGWLEPLVGPLEAEPRVLGTQPLLLYPDGTIQTAGTVFLDGDTLPRHFLSGHPVGDAIVAPNADFSAVTAAALCVRAIDFIDLHGFDPIYTNGLEDVDLCLRARELHPGGMFRVVMESRVMHHEGKTPGRARAIGVNRQVFVERWAERVPRSDNWRYEALGIAVDD